MANVFLFTNLLFMTFIICNGKHPQKFDSLVQLPSWKYIEKELIEKKDNVYEFITLEEMFDLANEHQVSLEYAYVKGYQVALNKRTVKYIYLITHYATEIVTLDGLSESSKAAIQKVINIFGKMRDSLKNYDFFMSVAIDRSIEELQINDSRDKEYYLVKLDGIRRGFQNTMGSVARAFKKKNTISNSDGVCVSIMNDLINLHEEKFDVAYVFQKDPKEIKTLIDILNKIEKLVEEEYRNNNDENIELKRLEENYYNYYDNYYDKYYDDDDDDDDDYDDMSHESD